MVRKIAVCGSSGFWRSFLLHKIAQTYSGRTPVLESFFAYGTESIDVPLESCFVHLLTLQPQYLDDAKAYAHLFQSADVVVYVVCEAVYKDTTSYESASEAAQVTEFLRCREYSVRAGVSWEQRPWVWVFTQDMPVLFRHTVDDIERRPVLAERIPNGQSSIRCSLDDAKSIGLLWQRLVSLVA